MNIVWQDPPERSRASKWRTIAAQLDERPGKWALVQEYEGENAKRNAYSLAGRIRNIFGDGFEVTSRSLGATRAGVWARSSWATELAAELEEGVEEEEEEG